MFQPRYQVIREQSIKVVCNKDIIIMKKKVKEKADIEEFIEKETFVK